MLKTSQKISYASLLICIGLVLPQVFHAFGGVYAGSIFLPMHIPVVIAGLLLGAKYGAIAGFILPVTSSLLSGMPAFTLLPFMTAELILYGAVAGLTKRMPLYVSLAATMLIGRFFYFILLCVLFYAFNITSAPAPIAVFAALSVSLPGIILQFVVVPPLTASLRRGY